MQPPESAHTPVSNRTLARAAQRFYSTGPTFGADSRRQGVASAGHEDVKGFLLSTGLAAPSKVRRAITELTYGTKVGPPSKAISGSAQTPVPDTTLYPWRVMASLMITVPGYTDLFYATGWFIGPYAVMTAAHAVYPREPQGYTGWSSQISVTPGMNGTTAPFGTVASAQFYCPTGWQQSGDPTLDYGMVLLDQGLGSQVGTLGYATYSDADIQAAIANLAGYPLTPPDGASPSGLQWYAAGPIASLDDTFIYYNLQTAGGESGSAVYRNIGQQSYSMAIHTSGDSSVGRGLRITASIYQNLQQWAGMRG